MAVELIADWKPLEKNLTPELCAEFMWMYREREIEHYKSDAPISPARRTWTVSGLAHERAEGGVV